MDSLSNAKPEPLPAGTEFLELDFAATGTATINVWWELPAPARVQVVLKARSLVDSLDRMLEPTAPLALLQIPIGPGDHAALLQRLKSWCDDSPQGGLVKTVILTLQGTQIVWAPGRVAILAPPERMATVARHIVEATYHERELRDLEGIIDAGWEGLQKDSPLAFEFPEKAVARRPELANRFQQVLGYRARYARLTSHVIVPHVHPPTLASQIGERLRERTRMVERLELLEGKLEVYERIYEMCSERSSEYMNARKGHRLEWTIIALLLIQTLLVVIELLSNHSKAVTP
jgi:hypothetical protein